MASRASSETPAIPSLPRLGTTWYRRGVPYWLRRAGLTLFFLLFMLAYCAFALGLYEGFRDLLPAALHTPANIIQAVLCAAALVAGWVTQRRSHHEGLRNPPTPDDAWHAKRAHNHRAPGILALGRAVLLIAAPVMPAIAAYLVSRLTAWTLVREYPSEVGARRWLAQHTPTGLNTHSHLT
ncbi:hypothetical protein IAG44_10545 [Streptomyces roseirectus]|uniref:Uncharacterized protein n=1 Tax=Streptomyces roseirectus TaxID=2768066 RepID=A0A7H0IAM5_9ACTN|nr:hypothetical protein [Streptomyces roseirectus]QNP69841.1 hypothetical protein IAG44_10545 [Streptomyces roseirectus]